MKKNLKTFLWNRKASLRSTRGAFSIFLALFLWHPPLQALTPPSELLIVLDPGHGGKDFGSIYKTKHPDEKALHEKDIVLDIAKETAKILRTPAYRNTFRKPIQVLLTRNKDIFLSLDKRAAISRTQNTKIFISIHANSEPTKQAHGTEIYILNNSSKESYSHHETLYKRRITEENKNSSLPLLLRSVATDAMSLPSRLAAQRIGQSLKAQFKKDKIQLKYRGVRQALLQVLLDVRVPSLLLEVAFLSNKNDRKLLHQKKTIRSIAKGLTLGILSYLEASEKESYWTILEEETPKVLHSR